MLNAYRVLQPSKIQTITTNLLYSLSLYEEFTILFYYKHSLHPMGRQHFKLQRSIRVYIPP